MILITDCKVRSSSSHQRFAILLGVALLSPLALANERYGRSASIVDDETVSQWGYQTVQNRIYNVKYCDGGNNRFARFNLAETSYQALNNDQGYRMVLIQERYPTKATAKMRLAHLHAKRNSRYEKTCGIRKIFRTGNIVYMVHTDWIQVMWNAVPDIFAKLEKYVAQADAEASSTIIARSEKMVESADSDSTKAQGWKRSYDFDGDGKRDRVKATFSGGGHCCYLLEIQLTLNSNVYALPFELDGGYLRGLDLSRPNQFNIRLNKQGLAELVMQIQTYNGKSKSIPEDWRSKYGISANRIIVGFPAGVMEARDLL